ncbi:MAG: methyltransferase domain-containing protein [Coriobacteriia bacterium]|nr:methyltransferase domain-containing protein [Coriobacteriia bacterium]
MDFDTAQRLSVLNTVFYREHSDSFSSTRQSAWPGWHTSFELIKDNLLCGVSKLQVFDLACGNMRYQRFLSNVLLSDTAWTYYAVDNCEPLVPQGHTAHYQQLDVLDVLLEDLDLNEHFHAPLCDLAVCFGFMHHTPLQENRARLLSCLVNQVRPGGYIIVTFWQFLNDIGLRAKALKTHEVALQELGLDKLEDNDFLLDWNKLEGVYRYCHSFTDEEIDELVERVSDKTLLVSRFVSDGRSSLLNCYLVLRAH